MRGWLRRRWRADWPILVVGAVVICGILIVAAVGHLY
jgi:hypothetical protein